MADDLDDLDDLRRIVRELVRGVTPGCGAWLLAGAAECGYAVAREALDG